MSPLQLALKMAFEPHMFAVFLLEYFEKEEESRQTTEFRKRIISDLQQIRDLYRSHTSLDHSETDVLLTAQPTPRPDRIPTVSTPLDAIDRLTFSPERLSMLLTTHGPITINNTVFAAANTATDVDIPIDLAELEAITVRSRSDASTLRFREVNGEFWKNENIRGAKLRQSIELRKSYRGAYRGSITVKSYTDPVIFEATRRKRITLSSRPALELKTSPLVYISLKRDGKLLREVVLLDHDTTGK